MRRASLLTVLLCACIAYAVAVTRLARTQQRLQSSASTKEVTALFNACAAKCETNSCVQQCANGANAASTPRPVVAEPASPPPVSSAPSITAPPISPAPASAAGSTAAAGDDDKDGITIVSNVNTLNDIPPPGAANGNGNPSADGSTNGGNNNGGNNQQPPGPPSQSRTVQKCPAFWQSNGCVRPKIPNAAAENGDCDGTVDNCVEKCCQNPIIYGNCQNYLTQKGCPANWEGKPSVEGVACGEDTVCQGRCCKPRPYTCAHFWDAKSCDPLTHTKFGGRDAFQCDPTSTHCVKVCCQPKTIQCPTYFQVYKQCPPVFRPNANDVACLPGFEWSRGDACFKRCCDAINHNDGRCSMWGDPHMITWDNVRFDCHTNGEYLLYSNDQMNEAVHNAQVKNPNPSLQHVPPFNIGMAFRAGTDVFSLELVPPSWATFQVNVRYNKKMVPYPDDEIQYGPFIVYPVGTLPTPNAGPADFSQAVGLNILNTRTGTGVAFWFFQTDYHQRGGNIDITIPDRGQKGRMVTKGLCGSWNGNAADDLTGAQGQRCDGGNSNVCCLSWTVPRDQSLFPHPPAEGGGHQEGIGTVCNSSAKLAQAKQFCNTAIGLHQDCVLEFCAGDGNKNLKSEIEQVFNGK